MTTRRPRSNLEIVFADWLDAMRRGDLQCMAGLLDPNAVHQGIRPEWVRSNRDEILESWHRESVIRRTSPRSSSSQPASRS